MILERIQVEEGFLDGLDLNLASGLNVIFGPRGCGKTSIIELIRFCLGAEALTEKVAQASREHALSILGSGRVTITMLEGSERTTISRSAESWTKTVDRSFLPPLILSQNEIEAVGLHAKGRLKLIDSIRQPTFRASEEAAIVAQIRSESQDRQSSQSDIQYVRGQIRVIEEELRLGAELRQQHQDLLKSLEQAKSETEQLNKLSMALAARSVRATVFERSLKILVDRRERLLSLSRDSASLEDWPASAESDDELARVRKLFEDSRIRIRAALQDVENAIAELELAQEKNDAATLLLQDQARTIRRMLESLRSGAGEVAKKLAVLQEKQSQLEALKNLEKAHLAKVERIQETRRLLLDQLEELRSERFEERAKTVAALNAELGPRIKIQIERAGQTTEYASAIVAALRGSGIKFNEVAPLIADQLSPREFIEIVENSDAALLSVLTGITFARSLKIVERINEEGVEDILTAPIEDGITFYLLDGKDYKTTEHLSTGQRCTVILPLLLQQQHSTLVVDQPEDHLDNAFIVDTLIAAIVRRKNHGQLIFSTHNANIPVLGGADRVVLMGSDGTRGFARFSGALNEDQSISAITTVMEGGLVAFDRRGKFYHSA